ncbi:MAG: hypothetical protein ACOYOV_16745 [Bacteroidales bacterium]
MKMILFQTGHTIFITIDFIFMITTATVINPLTIDGAHPLTRAGKTPPPIGADLQSVPGINKYQYFSIKICILLETLNSKSAS